MLRAVPGIEILFFTILLYEEIAHDAFFQNLVMFPLLCCILPHFFWYTFNTGQLYLFRKKSPSHLKCDQKSAGGQIRC